MARLEETTTVSTPIDAAFAYVSEFSNIADWDPGTKTAVKRGEGPPRVGLAYDLVTVFKGTESDMVYTITELDAPHRIVLAGTGQRIDATDTISMREAGGATEITYVAELSFKGLARFAEPFLGSALDELGKGAITGLEKALG